jgi:lipopolysaccharide transport system permease protein
MANKHSWKLSSEHRWYQLKIREVWEYRDLFFLLLRRDFVAFYKQTVLGPLWFFVQPIITLVVYSFVFGRIASISTDGIPRPLFYLPGIICWNYFSECLLKNSTVFRDNTNLFSKVYFPRIILPMSIIFSSMVRFIIQLCLFILVLLYYYHLGLVPNIKSTILLLPFLLVLMAAFGQGLGLIISALTTKYRDLSMLVNFGVQLLLFSTTVVYPLNAAPSAIRPFIEMNPMTTILESFRYSFLGQGAFTYQLFFQAVIITLVTFILGIILFSKVERNFIDTI